MTSVLPDSPAAAPDPGPAPRRGRHAAGPRRDHRTRVRRAAVSLVAALAVVALAEVAVRVLEPGLPAPARWGDTATAVKERQLDRIATEQGCVDVVFAGNSMARDAFDPATFAAADPAGRSAYNAALDAATPTLLGRWLPEQVAPRVHPATVVIGLASFDLNDASPAGRAAATAYETSFAGRDDWLGRLQQVAADRLALIRHRESLRTPDVLAASVARRVRGEAGEQPDPAGIPDVLGPSGEGLSRRDLSYSGGRAAQVFAREQLLAGFTVGGAQTAALGRLVADLRAQGSEVVLVALPVTEDYLALHPGGEEDYQEFLDTAQRVAAEQGAAFVDLHGPHPTEVFADTHHLNGTGATTFSTTVASVLAERQPDPPRCRPGG